MKPLQIGITGGIGSGKSVVCKILEVLEIPVYYADAESKKLLRSSPAIKSAVTALFGSEAYLPDGLPNRPLIAEVVFNNPQKLKELNAILHPAVHEHYRDWVSSQTQARMVAKEAAILFESGSYREMDQVIVVTAPAELRVKRVMERDGKTEEEIYKIIGQQMAEEEMLRRSGHVINNDDHHLVVPQLLEIIRKIKMEAGLS